MKKKPASQPGARRQRLKDWVSAINWRQTLLHTGVALAALSVLLGLIYLAFGHAAPELLPLLRSGDEEQIAQYLGRSGSTAGILSTALLSFIQPVSIVLPGAPIHIAAGVVYGTLQGFIICHLSYVFANVVIFYCARTLRRQLRRIRLLKSYGAKLDFLKREQYPAFMTAMACLVPVVPNGIIPYAAARTRMRLQEFTLAVYLGSFLPILIMCAIGKRILHGDYLVAGGLFGGSLLVVLVLTRLRKPICAWLVRVSQRLRHFIDLANEVDDQQ